MRVTMVNSPFGVQHFPWPVYSAERGFTNRSIIFHGAKRPESRAWRIAEAMGSGEFIPLERTCGRCDEMGWVTFEPSVFRTWRCCGSAKTNATKARTTRREKKVAGRVRRAVGGAGGGGGG